MNREKNNDLILNIYDKPSIGKWIILSLQHVFAMFGATILVPIVINSSCGETVITIPMALITSGIGTLIYLLCTKGKSPMYLGSSFAFIPPIIAAFLMGGRSAVFTGMMITGILYVALSFIVKFAGTKWIKKLLPPVVVGPMIIIIGLSLAPTAISEIGIDSESFNMKYLICALTAFIFTIIPLLRGKKFTKVIPFLIGIIAGYIMALILGIVNFEEIKNSSIIVYPGFYLPFKDYKLNFSAILTMIPIAIVTLAEHIGDHTVLSTIIGKNLLENPGLDKTLLGDGLAEFVAAFLGGPASSTYGENTSVIGITKVASVYVMALAAIIAILMGFSGQLTAILASIPTCVLGGVSIILYGYISINGLKVLIEEKVNFYNNRNVIIASTMLVLGLGGAMISITTKNFNISISGMALSAVVGALLNLTLPQEK